MLFFLQNIAQWDHAILDFRCVFFCFMWRGHTEDDFSDIKYFHNISLNQKIFV